MSDLVILHVDGLGYDRLQRALGEGRLPALARLIEREGYQALPYRPGLPSTTPFCQAGLLYGDNREIPGFRWWDKETGLLVAFGAGSTFKHVAHKYFRDVRPLTAGGAVVGSCYPAGAASTFGLAYRERDRVRRDADSEAAAVIPAFFASPSRTLRWIGHGGWAVGETAAMALRARLSGRHAERKYVVGDMLEEMLLHHVCRYAVVRAMGKGYPVIYGGFYAYDETGHGFGPEHPYSLAVLEHVDRTIGEVAAARRGHQLVVLSDHGQVETRPFRTGDDRTLGELVSDLLPNFAVREYPGGHYGPAEQALDGHVELAYSGGLAHLYFSNIEGRLGLDQIEARFPQLASRLARLRRIGFVVARDGDRHLLLRGDAVHDLESPAAAAVLSAYDDPAAVTPELKRLNQFERSGDLILFGETIDGLQVNFEHQVGGHGSLGGEQVRPFLLVKREWEIDPARLGGAEAVHHVLADVARRLR